MMASIIPENPGYLVGMQLAQYISRLLQCSLFCMQIIVREGFIASCTTGTIFYNYVCRPSVSRDTVSLLNVSTRFYLGVHAVRNIATTVDNGSRI